VDRVDVGAEPTAGIPTFIYDTNNGTFDLTSVSGVGGAFTAATSTDVGSPGIAPDASPIVLTQQPSPASFTIPINSPVNYTISGYGLPKPKFQWLFNGQPVDTNALGAVIISTISNNMASSTLTISSVQIVDNGTFSAIATNGVQTLTSSNSILNVTTTPSAPAISVFSPNNLTAYLGQTITYTVSAFGSPTPTYQWRFNGTNIPGQTSSQFQTSLSDTNQSGTYSVVLTNSAGSTNASAVLIVTPKPTLKITEAMSSESTNTSTGDVSNHSDWWELSNLGNFPVNLQGYRFDDATFSLAAAFTITNNVTIQPVNLSSS
jgi:beta-galactosidase